jgi:hypothetical protein
MGGMRRREHMSVDGMKMIDRRKGLEWMEDVGEMEVI